MLLVCLSVIHSRKGAGRRVNAQSVSRVRNARYLAAIEAVITAGAASALTHVSSVARCGAPILCSTNIGLLNDTVSNK